MIKQLSLVWSAWKIAGKRFGPVGGLVAAVLSIAGIAALKRVLRPQYPEAADALDQLT